MNITIEMIPDCTVAFIRRIGPYGADNKHTMEQLKDWARSNNLLNEDAIVYGIAQDSPDTTKPERCRYDTCLVIGKEFVSEEEFIKVGNLTGGKYWIFKIEHTAEAVQAAWKVIFSKLKEHNYELDETRPIMERYRMKMINEHFCEICVPVL